jgi:signal transduction histidine kinase
MLLTALVIAAVLGASIWAIRRLTMPYSILADAAERFGRDRNPVQLPESGPREVRIAAHAFNLMQERLQRFLADRDQLVAAVSHDLRTPVTRLRLRAEFVEDADQRTRMLADLEDIESMTRAVLAFARDAAHPEPREPVDLISLLDALCSDQPDVALTLPSSLPPRIACQADPVALRRCIANLIDNAIKYGTCARVALTLAGSTVRVSVDDDGPGIAEADREQVFRPFFRLEASRNRETGGTGLGLTIARTVARAHGGDVVLANRPEGGLRAELVLPLASATNPASAAATSGDCGTSTPRSAA